MLRNHNDNKHQNIEGWRHARDGSRVLHGLDHHLCARFCMCVSCYYYYYYDQYYYYYYVLVVWLYLLYV